MIPSISGLEDIPYLTYLQIFDNDHLPKRFMIIGAGPISAELAQAYQRLGSQVTLIDIGLLPREEPEVAGVMGKVFAREGIRFVEGRLLGVEIMIKLGKLDLPAGIDFEQAKAMAKAADQAVREGKLGYALLIGRKSP